VHITFFLESGEEIQLESQEGALYTRTKNIELWGAVHAFLPRGYQMATERALYDHQKKTISSETPVRLTGPDVQLEGKFWNIGSRKIRQWLKVGSGGAGAPAIETKPVQ